MKKIRLMMAAFLCLWAGMAMADSITPAAPTICNGTTLGMTTSGTGGTWSSSNVFVATIGSNSGVVTGTGAGTTKISYVSPSGTTTVVLTVNSNPIGNFSPNPSSRLTCVGNTVTFGNTLTGGTWASSNTDVATIDASTGVATGISIGTSNITYAITGGCYKVTSVNIMQPVTPITGTLNECVGDNTTLYSHDPNGNDLGWFSSNSAIAKIGSVSFGIVTGMAAGTAIISYRSGYGCYATATVTVGGVIAGSGSVCVGSTTTLSASPAGSGTWISGDVSKATIDPGTGVVTGVSAGTVNITYAPGTGCQATTVVTVNAAPLAITGPSIVASQSTITLNDATTGGTWSSANTTIATVGTNAVTGGTSGIVKGWALGTTTISYTLPSGCYATASITVTVGMSGFIGVCFGKSSFFVGHPAGGTWESSNPSVATISSSGEVTSVSYGTTTISYTLSGQTATMEVKTHDMPSLDGIRTMCLGGSTTLNVTNDDVPFTWQALALNSPLASAAVNKSVATSSMAPVTSATAPGTDEIVYQIYHNPSCQDTFFVTVTANPAFTFNPTDVSLCQGESVTFTVTPTGGTWEIPHDPYYTEASITSGGVLTALTRIADHSVVPIWYYTDAACMGYTQVTVNPCVHKAAESNHAMAKEQEYSVMPNPSSGPISITQSILDMKPVSIRIFNYAGTVIYKDELIFKNGLINVTPSVATTGVYVIELRDSEGTIRTQKIVIQR